MIAFIKGTLVEKGGGEATVETPGGVGYILSISQATLDGLPTVGAPVRLLTHLSVREDAQQLFGFLTAEERDLFRILTSVQGVGPKLALSVLSGILPRELQAAVLSNDLRRLVGIPGVGRKLAERLVVELREKLGRVSLGAGDDLTGFVDATAAQAQVREEALMALVSLGVVRATAERAVRQAIQSRPAGEMPTVQQLVKEGLRLTGPQRGG